MLDAIELYAARAHRSSLGDCLRGMRGSFTAQQKVTLLIRWAKAALRGVVGITK